MIRTILTHPGSAHKDDLLAVSLFVATYGAPILRRDPTQGELDDPSVAVIDVGGEHDPSRSNFDHHHFPRDHVPTCSLSLVLQALGLYHDAAQFCDWLEPAEWFDSRGPQQTAERLGVPPLVVAQLSSPIDAALLRRFARERELTAGDPLYECIRFIGEDLLEQLSVVRERIAFVRKHAERWSVPTGDQLIEVLFLPRTDPPGGDPGDSIADYIRAEGLQATIAAIVYPDGRGQGYGLGRFQDHPKLDFSRVEEQPDVHFAHKTGFMCKTTATAPSRLRELIVAAWRS